MSKKTASERAEEIWTYIKSRDACSGATVDNIKGAIRQNGQSDDGIAMHFHLGWWVRGGDAESNRRKAVRAAAFLNCVNLKLTSEDAISRQLTLLKKDKKGELDERIDSILTLYARSARKSSQPAVGNALITEVRPEFAPSMQATGPRLNGRERMLGKNSLTHADTLMARTWTWLVKAKTAGSAARAYFELCFGPYDQGRYNTVKRNFQTIHSVVCGGEVVLHLRTMKTVGMPDDTPGAVGNIQGHIDTANGRYNLADLFAWAIPRGADGKPHIFLCDVFFSTNAKGPHAGAKAMESGSGQDNIGGVMIHELSHALCGTADVVHPDFNQACYGRPLCQHLAANYPDLAVNNADNYEIYCEDTENRELF
ncbi:hypothetical protein Mal15_55390 [Stieleria maiorica]|uniref:Lysine-specific metallo-endopeptidase domain-containing protein n=1 Tax=Stieleria maiorica TaxID=2795974 RepID=A0A5B9MJA8_9BACT|nr:M35 family metallo-endopeptidase [Stieleria maiorica]QEG01463.1 hypothetical protein Mal15_55390 [Stieleria maiorica]